MQEGLPHGGEYVVAYTGEHLYSPEAAARATASQVSSLSLFLSKLPKLKSGQLIYLQPLLKSGQLIYLLPLASEGGLLPTPFEPLTPEREQVMSPPY